MGAAGRSVRCLSCRNVWFAQAGAPVPEVAALVMTADLAVPAAPPPQPVMAPVTEYVTADAPASVDTNDSTAEQAPESPTPTALDDAGAEPAATPTTDSAAVEVEPAAAVIVEAPSIVPPAGHAPLPEPNADMAVEENVESFAARRARLRQKRKKASWAMPGLPTIILALIILVTMLLGWRTQVVRLLPQTASFYEAIGLPVNLRGLDFGTIKTTREMHEGVPVLVVEGSIVATTGRLVEVPRLRFAVRNAEGKEIYSWTAMPSRPLLGPGESLPFRSRLASPPPEGRDVSVRFFTRRDSLAGAR